MITYQEAQQVLIQHARSFGKESIDLSDADGRVLAEVISSDRDYPPFNRVAMDGYALRLKDFQEGIRHFEIVETIYAGGLPRREIMTGQCYKIMTGAALPASADLVVKKEDTQDDNGKVQINIEEAVHFQNISRRGEDLLKGAPVVENNRRCSPALISVLASLGKHSITVEKLPEVALFTTGDEIIDIHELPGDVEIRNSNRYLLLSLLKKWGIRPSVCSHIKDNRSLLLKAFGDAAAFDIIIVCGGVSAGDADYVPEILQKLGADKLFHKVAIKPGKPLWCGVLPSGGMVFALPGNPFSCMVTFKLFIEFFLAVSFNIGLPNVPSLSFSGTRIKKSSLDEFFPVRVMQNPFGLVPLSFNGSGDITAALAADGIARHQANTPAIQVGDLLDFYSL